MMVFLDQVAWKVYSFLNFQPVYTQYFTLSRVLHHSLSTDQYFPALFAQNNAYSFFFSPFLEDQFLPAASPESFNQPPGHSLPLETQKIAQYLHENTLFLLLNPFPVPF
jgi:hypothetical protein